MGTRMIRALCALTAAGFCGVAAAQQASLDLSGCEAAPCYTTVTSWTLLKDVLTYPTADNGGLAEWTVTAKRGDTSDPVFSIVGYNTIPTGGSARATIGNIVVNLQRQVGSKWQTVSSNVADATSGDAAISARICPQASSENKSVFSENNCSGTLEFTDVDNNTAFSMVPQPVIAPGASVSLKYISTFDPTCAGFSYGDFARSEVIVTFGNAGRRGNSGASCSNIDADGSGTSSPDEQNVRSVPCRVTFLFEEAYHVNDFVTVTDPQPTPTGTVTVNAFWSDIGDGVTINDSTTWVVSALLDGGAEGGEVCNTAYLVGEGSEIVVGGSTFSCAAGADLFASACVEVAFEPQETFDYCTYSQGGYGGNGVPNALMTSNFALAFPGGIVMGGGTFTATFTTAAAVTNFLPQTSGGGTCQQLNASLVNPTSTAAGNWAGQLLALKVNVGLSDAGVLNSGFGDLTFCATGDAFTGMTVRQIVAAMDAYIGGGSLPSGYNCQGLRELAENLNQSFHPAANGDCPGPRSSWATQNLCQ
jgi:hypothetical protein